MRKLSISVVVAALLVGGSLPAAVADVAIVVEQKYAYPATNYFSAFAVNDANDIFTAGYSANQEFRGIHILNDANLPWNMQGEYSEGVRLNWFQLNLFALNGYPGNSGSIMFYGMNHDPVSGRYFLESLAQLRGPGGGPKLDIERDISVYDPRLPNSLNLPPTGVTLSNAGGVYSLVDVSPDPNDPNQPRAKFLSSGVQVGDRITLYPVDTWAAVTSGTYTITAVVDETTLYLDRDPVWSGQTTATEVGYLLSIQPWITLGTFRSLLPFYVTNSTTSPKAEYKGGFSPDYSRLYVGDFTEGSLLSINTQAPEDMSILVPKQAFADYVQAQASTGRHMAVRQKNIYTDSLATRWENQSVGATFDPNAVLTDPNGILARQGSKAFSVLYTAADGKAVLYFDVFDPNDPNNPPPPPSATADFGSLRFFMNGGPTGGQSVNFYAIDPNGVAGPAFPITLQANSWTTHEIPASTLGVGQITKLVWASAAGVQPLFYVDFLSLRYSDTPPPGIADFDPNTAKIAGAQVATDAAGRIWFQEYETRDILWTTDGTTLHTFITSNEIWDVTHGNEASEITQGVQAQGFILDRMGTIYWGDNASPRSFWKIPACGGAENIRSLASYDEVRAATGFAPQGMNCFSLRGNQLLTFTFATSAFIYKIDLKTYDYGDFSEDIDVDGEDLDLFALAMAGPDIATAPVGCDPVLFQRANLDLDTVGDVDLVDFAKLQRYATGALP